MSTENWPAVLSRLSESRDLSTDQAAWAMEQVFAGKAEAVQIAAFIVLLRSKGVSTDEMAVFVDRALAAAAPLPEGAIELAVDVVGTGGDGSNSVNISTMASIVAAAAGAVVVKHGNRSASSKCGSADLLESLGIDIEMTPDRVAAAVREIGIGFCFARTFHPGMRFAGPVRASLGIPTVFNLMAPLLNPGRPLAGVVGCADAATAPLIADVFARRGASVFVVRGDDGLDEITTATTTTEWIVSGGRVSEAKLHAAEFGLAVAGREDLRGGDPLHNAAVAREVFAGKLGPVRDAVLINAAAALVTFHAARDGIDLHDEDRRRPLLEAALEKTAGAIDSGAVSELVERWKAFS